MNKTFLFLHLSLLPWIGLLLVLWGLWLWKLEKAFFAWVKDHWFFERSKLSRAGFFLYMAGLSLMGLSLLDLRGPPSQAWVDSGRPKTMILIDASASMLAEDVHPNRFERGLFLARHFVKEAPGHLISLFLFSEHVRQVSPFTDDTHFLDAKIQSLRDAPLEGGGSKIVQAIKEALPYFKFESWNMVRENVNMIIISDGEEHEEQEGIFTKGLLGGEEIPVNIAFLGLGTPQGAPIPLKNEQGHLTGYKTYQGNNVVTRLDPQSIKNLGRKTKNFSYWFEYEQGISTAQVLRFFQNQRSLGVTKNREKLRPARFHYFLVPGILLLVLGYALRMGKNFRRPLASLLLLFLSLSAIPPLPARTLDKVPSLAPVGLLDMLDPIGKIPQRAEDILKKKKWSRNDRLILAEYYLNKNLPDQGLILYEESFFPQLSQWEDEDSLFNYGTALLMLGKINQGISLYHYLALLLQKKKFTYSGTYEMAMRNNILLALRMKNMQQKMGQGPPKERQGEKGGKESEKTPSSGKENEKNENEKDQSRPQDQKKEPDAPQPARKEFSMGNVLPVLHKLMDEDRDLQKKFYKSSLERNNNGEKGKDW